MSEIIYCIYLNFLLYFQTDTCIKEQSQAFYSNLTWKQESKKLWELENLPGFSSGLHGLQQEFPNLSQAVNCTCLLVLCNISPSMPTTHSLLCIFTRILSIYNCFQKFFFKKSSEVSQVLLSNMNNPVWRREKNISYLS